MVASRYRSHVEIREIREIRASEHEALGELTVAAYRGLAGRTPLGSYENLLRDVGGRSVDCIVIVAVDSEATVIGGVTYVPGAQSVMSEFSDPDAAGMRMLAVDPAYQGNGAGRALTLACIDRARADGRRRLLLHSTPVMMVAQAMYEHLGFVRAPASDEWVTDPPHDELIHLMGYVLDL